MIENSNLDAIEIVNLITEIEQTDDFFPLLLDITFDLESVGILDFEFSIPCRKDLSMNFSPVFISGGNVLEIACYSFLPNDISL